MRREEMRSLLQTAHLVAQAPAKHPTPHGLKQVRQLESALDATRATTARTARLDRLQQQFSIAFGREAHRAQVPWCHPLLCEAHQRREFGDALMREHLSGR